YICGDITKEDTKDKLYQEIDFWKKKEKVKRIDVVIATPPCQGMSVANHKKNDKEIVRNSLVVESIKIIQKIHPRFFVFENVPAFMKTICTDIDGADKPIADAISCNLGKDYSYTSQVINFKDYGAKGILSEKRFLMLSESIEKEQSDVLGKIATLEKRLEIAGSKARKVEEFAQEIRQYAEITELTDEILHKLIQRIEVGRTEEIDGERIQHIKVIYDFVGEIGTDVEIEFMNGNYKSAKVCLVSDK
ncbi:MAG: DUF4368 domain-containing protein, partial [Anaerovoracaceae bacterium]|nr:DUF4368 domain-containing protein [Anaerovoracaceae bacterium]